MVHIFRTEKKKLHSDNLEYLIYQLKKDETNRINLRTIFEIQQNNPQLNQYSKFLIFFSMNEKKGKLD